ncbi:unnamed protein product [Acanthoscelides obtectus]|uniref:Uncharacterized protein n=1 Tax=Acanthoscelides obtectus TaxID=200917 RepID=A0A9P0Q2M0_ACAOB|nr:unnamed protein product [Acanthoscelides obtectus]CAK1628406.1 hypothetical protein AOBTE_LOCUS5192 [Acanthoscelides obtectus]
MNSPLTDCSGGAVQLRCYRDVFAGSSSEIVCAHEYGDAKHICVYVAGFWLRRVSATHGSIVTKVYGRTIFRIINRKASTDREKHPTTSGGTRERKKIVSDKDTKYAFRRHVHSFFSKRDAYNTRNCG